MQQLVSQLIFDRSRDRFQLDGCDVLPGDLLRVLVYDGIACKEVWIDTTMQLSDDGNYFLDGLLGYCLTGLFACRRS